jgi:hypothetical protein
MKGKKGLERMYDVLNWEERFRLVLEALSRQDEAEVSRLSETCPLKTLTWTQNDPDFADPVRASSQITLAVCSELTQLLSTLQTIELLKEHISFSLERLAKESALSYQLGWHKGCDHAWWAADKQGPFPWNDGANLAARARDMAEQVMNEMQQSTDGGPQRDLEDARETLLLRVRSLWEAFSRLCRTEMNLDSEKVVRAWYPPALDLLDKLRNVASGVQIDNAMLEEHESQLDQAWRELRERA